MSERAGTASVETAPRPRRVAEVVHGLVVNPYITAQTFSVDGGMHPR